MVTPAATSYLGHPDYRVIGMDLVIGGEPMRKLFSMVERVSHHNAAVMITGETGSGKELIARAIHHFSPRGERPWVDVNCAALPEHLIESELFGYEKGAFSGAESLKQGLVELADKGTLFLDEIGELRPSMQVKLLRVLDGMAYYRLGGSKKITVDVRIVAATNVDLQDAVRAGTFRADLFHRISQFHLKVPPLRDRREDILALAEYFLNKQRPGANFTREAINRLVSYSWPGNVRELRNAVIKAAMMATGNDIEPEDLPVEVGTGGGETADAANSVDLSKVERETIVKALQQTRGNQVHAADLLGISRRTLNRKLKQYDISVDRRRMFKPLGQLSPEQQKYFRSQTAGVVRLRRPNGEIFQTTTTNIGAGGLGLRGVTNPLELCGDLEMELVLPGTDSVVKGVSNIAWADASGVAGLRFKTLEPGSRATLDTWLLSKRKEEGWE